MKKIVSPLLLIAIATPALAGTRIPVSFRYTPERPVHAVSVVGDFNAWDATSQAMSFDPRTNRWQTRILLPPGEHPYKFALDGKTLVSDPRATKRIKDGFGNFNSAIEVFPAPTLNHTPGFPDRTTDGKTMYLRLNAPRGALAAARLLIDGREFPLTLYARTASMDCFHLALPARRIRYSFRIMNEEGWQDFGPRGKKGGRWSYDPGKETPFQVPSWAKGAVVYQIFPERFQNGDPSNDPPHCREWGEKPAWNSFAGGDLAGILQRFAHLKSLGIDALYLNPIFEASSNHKYDTTEYRKIDPHFGNQQTFTKLRDTCHRAGMKLLLDGVFNHTGTASIAFRDVAKKGAASPYKDWYHCSGFPIVESPKPNYEAWWGYASLPKLNHGNPTVRQYLLRIGQHWLQAGSDGWRLDVPNEVPQDFWISFRQTVKKANPEALIIGEIWKDGTPWLDGKHFDSVMNYRFREDLLGLLSGKMTARTFGERMAQIRADYPEPANDVLMNLIGSHDTSRFLSECQDVRKLKLAAFLQMTYPGMPAIYYGDEIGMTGGGDPDNRRGMTWDRLDRALLGHYRELIRWRHRLPALRQGDFRELLSQDEGLYAFQRGTDTLVVLNATNRRRSWSQLQQKIPAIRQAHPLYPSRHPAFLGPYSGTILSRHGG